ncbi:MAG: hypothetical protein ABIT71_24465 [Vicinamibacteraceae bacterium]
MTLELRSPGAAGLVQIFYAGEEDGVAPFEFVIRKGKNKLLLVAVGAVDRQRMLVLETFGAGECPLKLFTWTRTHFFTTLDIEGV